jgi:hypothetical protein
MQQAFYSSASIKTFRHSTSRVREITLKWDLAGVLALLGSSAAYGVFALSHTGL